MTKQAVIAIVVGVIILFGAAGAFLYSQNKQDKPAEKVTAMKAAVTPANSMAGQSISDLLSSGKTSKCTFNSTTQNATNTGTVYVSGDKARADFDMTVAGKNTTTHMIRTGDTFYMWGDSLPVGMKMVMNINDLASKMQGDPGASSFDPSKKVDFKCVTWSEDATLFTPPTTVKFTSIQGMMPGGATGAMMKTTGTPTQAAANTTGGASNQCNICAALTGNAKSQCMAQFNCK